MYLYSVAMQKECKIFKDQELIKLFKFSMIRPESAVPDSSKNRILVIDYAVLQDEDDSWSHYFLDNDES